jgi:hypothetical protein
VVCTKTQTFRRFVPGVRLFLKNIRNTRETVSQGGSLNDSLESHDELRSGQVSEPKPKSEWDAEEHPSHGIDSSQHGTETNNRPFNVSVGQNGDHACIDRKQRDPGNDS